MRLLCVAVKTCNYQTPSQEVHAIWTFDRQSGKSCSLPAIRVLRHPHFRPPWELYFGLGLCQFLLFKRDTTVHQWSTDTQSNNVRTQAIIFHRLAAHGFLRMPKLLRIADVLLGSVE